MDTVAAKPINLEVEAFARQRLAELRALTFEQLKSLPEAETRALDILGKRVQLTVWRTSESPDQTLVVVQVVRERWFGITSSVHAFGFIARSNGEKHDASEEALWDYT